NLQLGAARQERIDARIVDAERLFPRVQEQPFQSELTRCSIELVYGGVRLVWIHARQPDEAWLARHRLGDQVVGWAEVIAGRLERADDRALHIRGIHPREQFGGCLARPEQRLAHVGERVDRRQAHTRAWTRSSSS